MHSDPKAAPEGGANRRLLILGSLGGLVAAAAAAWVWLYAPGRVQGGSQEHPESPTLGVALADCAPWDGAATSLFLSDRGVDGLPPLPPYLQVIVYTGGDQLPGTTVRLGEDRAGSGLAVRCESSAACATADAGTVEFAPVTDDSTLTGAYRLAFPDGTISRAFRARWIRRVALCG